MLKDSRIVKYCWFKWSMSFKSYPSSPIILVELPTAISSRRKMSQKLVIKKELITKKKSWRWVCYKEKKPYNQYPQKWPPKWTLLWQLEVEKGLLLWKLTVKKGSCRSQCRSVQTQHSDYREIHSAIPTRKNMVETSETFWIEVKKTRMIVIMSHPGKDKLSSTKENKT